MRGRAVRLLALLPAALLAAGLGLARPALAQGPHTGYLEVCKAASGEHVTGTFDFDVNGHTYTVPVGACTLPIEVTAGQVTVTEAASAGFAVSGITSAPSGTLVSSDLTARTATVTVAAGDISTQTILTFVNQAVSPPPPPPTHTGMLTICKVAGHGVHAGTMFSFTVNGAAHPVDVAAGSCSDAMAVPAGTATVTESAAAGFAVTAIDSTPSGSLVSSDLAGGSAMVNVTAGDPHGTTVTFTNEATTPPPPPTHTGMLTICKVAGHGVDAGTMFWFSVNDGHPLSVAAGHCSDAMTVPSGTATVVEQAQAGFTLTGIASAPDGSLVAYDLTAGSATVNVTAGDPHGTTVTFTNEATAPPPPPPPHTGLLTICKVAGDGVSAGTTFSFTVNGSSTPVTVAAGHCSDAMTVPSGTATVVEQATAGVAVTAIASLPSGSLVSSDLAGGSATVNVTAGDPHGTTVSFTNSAVTPPPPAGCTYTKGYYKNHPDALNALLGGSAGGTLSLGGATLSRDQLVAILSAPIKGNLSIQLAAQLITAMANQANGASVPSSVATAMASAQASLTITVSADGSWTTASSLSQDQVSALVDALTAFNESNECSS